MADSLAAILTSRDGLWALRHSLAGDSAAMAFLQGASEPEPRAEGLRNRTKRCPPERAKGTLPEGRIQQEDRFPATPVDRREQQRDWF